MIKNLHTNKFYITFGKTIRQMIQIVEQTHEQKMSMYMKLSKKKLAEMLIQCNTLLESKPLEIVYPKGCHHNMIQKDAYWRSCTHCGQVEPLNV